MFRPVAIFLGATVLAACQPAAQQPSAAAEPREQASAAFDTPAPAARPAENPTTIDSLDKLAGEYRLAGIDGKPLDADSGIALSIEGQTLSFEPRCAGFVWRIAFEGERLVTQRPGLAASPGGTTRPVCAVAIHPEQQRLAAALDAATAAERTQSNAVQLSGGGHSVTLFSQ